LNLHRVRKIYRKPAARQVTKPDTGDHQHDRNAASVQFCVIKNCGDVKTTSSFARNKTSKYAVMEKIRMKTTQTSNDRAMGQALIQK
jgi:hypothetical protein